ncbi:MAG: hypothetical protein L6R41_002412 [Letrouitia leprolyta]|nr:MAG: hypothetical protein L6R41_002412 [Letrouitia leprolyta]
MASSSNAPGNMGNWRGRGDWNPRGWGTNVRGRGRGRGGYATGSGGEGSYRSQTAGRRRPLVSLREHAGASIVPLERRHRIYLSGDRPQETSGAVPAGQAPPGDQDQEDTQPSSSSAEGDDGGAQTEAGHATLGGDNVSPGQTEEARDDIWHEPTYIERFRNPRQDVTSESAMTPSLSGQLSETPTPEQSSQEPLRQDPDDLLIFDDDDPKTEPVGQES